MTWYTVRLPEYHGAIEQEAVNDDQAQNVHVMHCRDLKAG